MGSKNAVAVVNCGSAMSGSTKAFGLRALKVPSQWQFVARFMKSRNHEIMNIHEIMNFHEALHFQDDCAAIKHKCRASLVKS